MKICIVTLCEAVNYGAFLQAYSLKTYLEKRGHTVFFLRTYSKPMIKTMIKSLYTYNVRKMKFKSEFRHGYFCMQKKLNKTFRKSGYDLVIIGSDEVWQLRNSTAAPRPEFFGIGIKSKTKIVYAACSNNTEPSDILKFKFVSKGINELDAISVRDNETQNVYRSIIGDVPLVLDPTFLIDINELIPEIKYPEEPYIIVYTYNFDERKIKIVKEFAKQKKLKIISVGQKFAWCDECVPCNAFEFLGYIKNAQYIFTDTFHGTVLSMQLKKNFFAFGQKKKVKRILNETGMSERNVDDNPSALIGEAVNADYTEYDEIISRRREESINFLDKFI